jgi:hypothetical protein
VFLSCERAVLPVSALCWSGNRSAVGATAWKAPRFARGFGWQATSRGYSMRRAFIGASTAALDAGTIAAMNAANASALAATLSAAGSQNDTP